MKHLIDEFNRLGTSEKKIRELEDLAMKTTENKRQKGKKAEKKMKSLSDLWDNITLSNTCVISVLGEKMKIKGSIVLVSSKINTRKYTF